MRLGSLGSVGACYLQFLVTAGDALGRLKGSMKIRALGRVGKVLREDRGRLCKFGPEGIGPRWILEISSSPLSANVQLVLRFCLRVLVAQLALAGCVTVCGG